MPPQTPTRFNPSSFPKTSRQRQPLLLLSGILAAGLLPVQAQVTVELVDQGDAAGASTLPLTSVEDAAVRGGNVAYSATAREASFSSRNILRLNAATAVRGSASNSSLPPGDTAPGTTSTFSNFLPGIFVNASGRIAFTANLNNSSGNEFWAGTPTALQLVARNGTPAPGTNGTFLLSSPGLTKSTLLAFNDAGQVAFQAAIEGVPAGTDSGWWVGAPGALQLVARPGSQVPGFPVGTTWTGFGGFQLNALGHVGMKGSVNITPPADTLVTATNVIMVGPPGALQLVAKAGDPAPDAEPFTFLNLSNNNFTLNSSGQIVFLATIEPGRFAILPSTSAIYLGSGTAGSKLVARRLYPAPGTDADAVFGDFDPPLINAAGEVAFSADVRSAALTNSQGIWLGKPGRLRKIARTNDVAPGTGGQLFGALKGKRMALSDSGQVAFLATFSPGGGIFGNNATTGLFATDKTGNLQLVARVGSAIGSGLALNQVQIADVSGCNDSKRTAFDTDGRLVFTGSASFINPDRFPSYLYRATFPESAPVILPNGQPLSVRASTGGSAVLEVNAIGSRPATFQWQRNGQNVPGATSATLSLNALTEANRGTYTVIVTNAHGSLTSSAATLTFPPVLTTQPLDVQINAGTTLTLPAAATGPGTISYQWQFKALADPDFTNVSGAAAAVLSLPNIATNQSGRYRVIATNSDGSTTSREAIVTVAAAGDALVRRIYIPGDPVPGISSRLSLAWTEDPVINNAGAISFKESVGINTAGTGQGTYIRSPEGQFRYVTYQAFSPNLSDSGVLAQLNSRPLTTIELGHPDNMLPLARTGEPAPGGVGGNYYQNGAFALADNGTTAFRFSALSPSNVFYGEPGAVSLLGKANGPAPGLPTGVNFDSVMDPVINPSGTASFFARLTGTGITANNDTSLWKGTPAGVQRLISEGDLVPAAGSGVRVGEIMTYLTGEPPFGWNEAGQVAFSTTLAGTGITTANDKAILAGLPGSLAIVARQGVSDGHTFSFSLPAYPLINRTGQVAFVATVTPAGTSDFLESVWLWKPGPGGGTRQLIAREGQQAPGLAPGIVMDSAQLGRPLFSFAMNGAGQLVMTTRLSGPGISNTANNDVALYITNPAGQLKLIARTGGLIDVGGGETRELDYMTVALRSGGEDGRRRSFTESGEVVFMASLKKPGAFYSDYSLFTARLAPDTTALTAAYNTWATTAFPAGSPTAVTRADADPDKDGNPNAIEYLIGSNPSSASGSALTLLPVPNGIGFTFPRRVGVPDGFEIIESTASLEGSWTPVPRTAIKRTSNAAGQPDTVTVNLPAGEEKRFVKVRVAAF